MGGKIKEIPKGWRVWKKSCDKNNNAENQRHGMVRDAQE